MWEITVNQVKYYLRKQVYRDVDGRYYTIRKQYAVGKFNEGWRNLVPGGYRGRKIEAYTKEKETLDTDSEGP